VIRIDPATGAAAPGNALGGAPDANARRIVGYGLRNPFRFAFRPNSRELWIADVGSNTADEVDRIDDPTAPAHDFGWPCYEGFGPEPAFEPVGLELCTALYAQPDAVTQPYATFPVVTSDSTCDGRPTLSGVAFEESAPAGLFPAPYTGALFLADYTRSCVFVLPRGADGLPDPALVTLFASGLASPVDLTFGPDGALYYVDYDGGTVRRIAPTAPPAGLDYPSRATYATGAHAHGLALADLDADGKADLAVANAGASSVSVLLGHGDGTFGAAVSFAVGSEPKSVAAGDLNGDGHVDLVTANQGSNTVSILLGDGNGTFAAAVAVPACEHPHEVAVGQFDGDPAPDLAVACWGGSVVGVLLGKGDGTFAPELLVPAGDAPHSIVARDLDGDAFRISPSRITARTPSPSSSPTATARSPPPTTPSATGRIPSVPATSTGTELRTSSSRTTRRTR
jgi:hypothetical protein